MCSRPLMHRSKVVFPEPLAPMSTTTSPLFTSTSMSRRTRSVPNDLFTRSMRTIADGLATTALFLIRDGEPSLEPPRAVGQKGAQPEVDDGDEREDLDGPERRRG